MVSALRGRFVSDTSAFLSIEQNSRISNIFISNMNDVKRGNMNQVIVGSTKCEKECWEKVPDNYLMRVIYY